MDPIVAVDRQEVDKVKLFKETARVVVIDDKCGTFMDPGDMSRMMCATWAKSAHLFHVKDIQGSSPEEKIEDFRQKLIAAVGTDSSNVIFVLDRDLGIGNLPLSGDAQKSSAAAIDPNNDGPALVPFIRQWFNNAPIVGFTGEGDLTGMSQAYSGARVVKKPDYDKLKENLVEAYAEAFMQKSSLQEAILPPRVQD